MDSLPEAKAALLRALEKIEEAESEVPENCERVGAYVAVVYSVHGKLPTGGSWETGGWVATAQPRWVTAAMLHDGADAVEFSEPADADGADDPA